MARIELPSAQCAGLDMPDGARYDARDGYIEVERPDHLAQIGRTGLRRLDKLVSLVRARGVVCRSCRFRQLWALRERPCPRCGRCDYGEEAG